MVYGESNGHVILKGESRDLQSFIRFGPIGYLVTGMASGIGQTPCSCEHYLVIMQS